MKKIATWGMPLIAAWALSACGTTSSNAPAQQPTQPVAATETAPRAEAAVERFTCENGLNVQLRPLGQDQLELHLDDKRAALVRACLALVSVMWPRKVCLAVAPNGIRRVAKPSSALPMPVAARWKHRVAR